MSQVKALQLLKQGIAAAKAGNKPLTRRLLKEVTELDPENEVAWLWLAEIAESWPERVDCLQRVLSINPSQERALAGLARAWLEQGVAAAKAGDKPEARRLLLEVTSLEPGNEMAWLWLAGVAETPQHALDYLQRVLEINPRNERAHAGIKWAEAQLAKLTPPWKCPFCQAVAAKPPEQCGTCGAVLTLADVEALLNNEEVDADRVYQGAKRLERVAEKAPDFSCYYYLGIALLNLKQLPDGLAWIQAAVQMQTRDRTFQEQVQVLTEAVETALREQAEAQQEWRPTILIVDDSATVRKLVSMTLEKQGCQVIAAADAYEAVERLRDGGVNMVLLDITMPGMDGYQLCKLVRQNPDTRHLPVVMLSGKDGFFNKVRGRIAGSTEYITKPFDPEQLIRVVDRHCKAAPQRAPQRKGTKN